jgi:uncharacterized protein (DUF2252 family)
MSNGADTDDNQHPRDQQGLVSSLLPPSQTVAERQERGRALRSTTPRTSHAAWEPAPDRPDPVDLLEAQARTRLPDLTPVRYGRMIASPFTFLRGAAAVMAKDLARTPTTGLVAQLCGDCHLANFGVYASPERTLVFDINDFDETLPGPFEWDLKRLVASFVVAMRSFGLPPADRRAAALGVVETYRTQMGVFAAQRTIEVWYAHLPVEDFPMLQSPKVQKRLQPLIARAERQDHLRAFAKLTALIDGHRRIVPDPPLVVSVDAQEVQEELHIVVGSYRASLQNDRRTLLDEYRLVDLALKVVGVGSVGTRCYIALFLGRDEDDPLLLQLKEAQASVLEAHLRKSHYANHGRRVVAGQRLMQASSDIFLGWTSTSDRRDYYGRQLRDMKGSVVLGNLSSVAEWLIYAQVCGWSLARAHARSGDRIAIAAYLGGGPRFDEALADFAEAYADQTERDHAALVAAVKSGRVAAQTGV